jgi:hypothetical protein
VPFTIKTLAAASLAAVVAVTGYVPVANAFNFGDMMNPSRWMGGGRNRDRYDDYYDDYGPYGGGPWGGGPWGGGPWGGGPYGGPGYGFPGAYGAPYAAPPVAPVAPAAPAAPTQSSGGSEIDALKRRIEELESRQQPSQSAPANDWPSAPAFRPMNQY